MLADQGLHALTGSYAYASQGQTAPQAARVGWTNPTLTYTQMRRTDFHVQDLDPLIRANGRSDPTFLASWVEWSQNHWRPFYEKYAGPNASSWDRLGATLDTDELKTQADNFNKQLDEFDRHYRGLRLPNGQPVPQPALGAPSNLPVQPGSGITLPWWVWMIGGVALVGVTYYGYRKYIRPRLGGDAPAATPAPRLTSAEAAAPNFSFDRDLAALPEHSVTRYVLESRGDLPEIDNAKIGCGCSHGGER